jgi:hypothetical protein
MAKLSSEVIAKEKEIKLMKKQNAELKKKLTIEIQKQLRIEGDKLMDEALKLDLSPIKPKKKTKTSVIIHEKPKKIKKSKIKDIEDD